MVYPSVTKARITFALSLFLATQMLVPVAFAQSLSAPSPAAAHLLCEAQTVLREQNDRLSARQWVANAMRLMTGVNASDITASLMTTDYCQSDMPKTSVYLAQAEPSLSRNQSGSLTVDIGDDTVMKYIPVNQWGIPFDPQNDTLTNCMNNHVTYTYNSLGQPTKPYNCRRYMEGNPHVWLYPAEDVVTSNGKPLTQKAAIPIYYNDNLQDPYRLQIPKGFSIIRMHSDL